MIIDSTINTGNITNTLFKYKNLISPKYNLNLDSKLYKEHALYRDNKILPISNSSLLEKSSLLYFNSLKHFKKNEYNSQHFRFTRIGIVGIDRVKLYVKLRGVDTDKCPAKILQRLNKEAHEHSKQIIDIKTGEVFGVEGFEYFNIIDNKYKKYNKVIRYGLKLNNKNSSQDFILDINPPLALCKHPNEYNITLQELQTLLNDIKEEFESDGIYISYDDSRAFYLEINKNIIANEPLWKSYSNLRYLSDYVFNEKSTLQPLVQTGKVHSQTLTIEDARTKITLYDKSAQLHNVYNLDLNKKRLYLDSDKKIYRLEITFKNVESINRYFRSSNLNSLLNIDYLIKTQFDNIINRKFLQEIKRHLHEQYICILNMINTASLKNIKEIYSKNQDKIFDISIFGKAMFEKYKDSNKETNFSKAFKTFLKDCVNECKVNNLKELEHLIYLIIPNSQSLIDIPLNIERQIDNFFKSKTSI